MHRLTAHSLALPTASTDPWRRAAARLLRATGAVIHRQSRQAAQRLLRTGAPRLAVGLTTLPQLEFHADAGAPEGALYVDGEYVGRLDIQRL